MSKVYGSKGYSVHKYREKLFLDILVYEFPTFETEIEFQPVYTILGLDWSNDSLVWQTFDQVKQQSCLTNCHWPRCSLIQHLYIIAIIYFISLRAKIFWFSEIYMRIYFTKLTLFAYRRADLHSQSRVKIKILLV